MAERERTPASEELVVAVARNLFKLMAYKDEYEVARLHLDGFERRGCAASWAMGRRSGSTFTRRCCARSASIASSSSDPGSRQLRALRRLRRLRGTWLDPFGYAKVRRVERALVGEYEQMIDEALERLTPATHATAVELCELPEVIRGYEEIKLRNVALFRKRAPGYPQAPERQAGAADRRRRGP